MPTEPQYVTVRGTRMQLNALINALACNQADEDYTPVPIKCGDCDFVEICVCTQWLQWVYRCWRCDVYWCMKCRPKHDDVCEKCACLPFHVVPATPNVLP